MKYKSYFLRAVILIICLVTVIATFSSCSADMKIGDNAELAEQFVKCVVENDFEVAHFLVRDIVSAADFKVFWDDLRSVAGGARTYKIEQIGWEIKKENGVVTNATAHQVRFDNGKTVLLRVFTCEGIADIASMNYSDVTEFVDSADAFIPTVNVILLVISLLCLALSVWMFVDCMRRRLKMKVVWAILIFFGFFYTLTLGKTFGFSCMIGPSVVFNNIVFDPSLLSIKVRVFLPVGAVIYLLLRKRFTVAPTSEPDNAVENADAAIGDDKNNK